MRELAGAIEPHVAALDAFEPRVRSLVESTPLPAHKRERLAEALLHATRGEVASDADNRKDPLPPSGEASDPDGAGGGDTRLVDVPAQVVFEVVRGFHDARAAPRGPMLYGALLVQAIAVFESLMGTVYGEHFALHPSALDAQDKEFSLGELEAFADITEARDALIARKVDSFVAKGLTEWSRWTSQTLKATLEELAPDARVLHELFQRRHIIVHSAGRVSRQYLARVDFGSEPPPDIGTPLPVSRAYLEEALDALDVVGTLLALVAWQRWDRAEADQAASQLGLVGYDLLTSESWTATRVVCSKGRSLLNLPKATELQTEVNEWIARKRQDSAASIAPEVREWDVSAAAGRFQLARAALLDDLDRVFELLPSLIDQGEVTLTNFVSWPLLQEAREDSRAETLLEQFSAT
jgi:hypothetical protein